MRFAIAILVAVLVVVGAGCGGKFELPTEKRIAALMGHLTT